MIHTCKLLDEGSKRSRICSLYISKNEHLHTNFNFSSRPASFSWNNTINKVCISSFQKILNIDKNLCGIQIQISALNRTKWWKVIHVGNLNTCNYASIHAAHTFWILENRYSKTLGVIPQLTLCLRVPPSISPSIVWVFPLPVCTETIKSKESNQKKFNSFKHLLS